MQIIWIDQLKSIWSPTNPYDAKQYEKGYWTMNTTHRVDMRKLIGQKIRVAMVNVSWCGVGLLTKELTKALFSAYLSGSTVRGKINFCTKR